MCSSGSVGSLWLVLLPIKLPGHAFAQSLAERQATATYTPPQGPSAKGHHFRFSVFSAAYAMAWTTVRPDRMKVIDRHSIFGWATMSIQCDDDDSSSPFQFLQDLPGLTP